jgi:hypothetical protein
MLLIKDHRDVFKNPLIESSDPELLNGHAFKLSVSLDFFEVTLQLKLIRTTLVK